MNKLKIYKIEAANKRGKFVAHIQAPTPKIAAAKLRKKERERIQIFSIKA